MANDPTKTDAQAEPAPGTAVEAANPPDAASATAGTAPTQPFTVVLQQQDKHAEAAANMAAGQALQMDVAEQPGGVYIVNGQKVNANGHPVGSSLDVSSI